MLSKDKKDDSRANSEAAEKLRREQDRAKQEKERREKNQAQIDLAVQQGFLRSTESVIDRKKGDLRDLNTKLNTIKMAKEVADEKAIELERKLVEANKIQADLTRVKNESTSKARDLSKVEEEIRMTNLQISQLEQNRSKYQREIEELHRKSS
ncbi:MAG: hypothetical protein WCI52_00340 [bacterium]